jgi:hypothetical protein
MNASEGEHELVQARKESSMLECRHDELSVRPRQGNSTFLVKYYGELNRLAIGPWSNSGVPEAARWISRERKN